MSQGAFTSGVSNYSLKGTVLTNGIKESWKGNNNKFEDSMYTTPSTLNSTADLYWLSTPVNGTILQGGFFLRKQ
jgi:hypothetical protein